jgi:hypothetical protein
MLYLDYPPQVLKLYGWEKSFQQKVMNIRNQEVKKLRMAAFVDAFAYCSWFLTPFLVSRNGYVQ